MTSTPIVSIIIPCYNAQRWIAETLRSVEAQLLPNSETIVIDDGSSDDSAALVAGEFPWAHLERTSNEGPSQARNLGTALAKGRFIQYLDADDLLAPGKLVTQLAALETSEADVAYGDWQRLQANRDGTYQPGEIIARELGGDAEIALFTNFWCPPAAYLFRRSIIERIGGWNERLPVIQDARFALDAALHGGRFIYTPGVMAHYRMHISGSVSSRNQTAFWRDCYYNATEVESWWASSGGISQERRAALLQVYGYASYVGFDLNQTLFEDAHRAVKRLSSGRPPAHLQRLVLATRLVGYTKAHLAIERLRVLKAQIRAFLLATLP